MTSRNTAGREPVSILELYAPACQLRYASTNAHGTCPVEVETTAHTTSHSDEADWLTGTLTDVYAHYDEHYEFWSLRLSAGVDTGTRVFTLPIPAGYYVRSTVGWSTDPQGDGLSVEVSYDNGATWLACANGEPLPGMPRTGAALIRQTITRVNGTAGYFRSLTISIETTDAARACYNTLKTCPVPESFQPADQVLRFSTAQQAIAPRHQVRPTIVDIDDAPRRLAPSKGLGEGAEARITLLDHPWHDVGTDPYREHRDYDPISQGTFWGKFQARNPYYRGWRMRLITAYLDGDSYVEDSVREYIVDAIKGPDKRGQVTVIGTDIFKLLEKDRSVVPPPNTGSLAASIDENATSFTLAPAGIGDEEYPSAFRCVIGNEGFDVTRAGDTCTITQRGLYRGRDSHEMDDTVQIVRRFDGMQVNQIAEALITEAQPQLAEYIPSAEWQAEADEYLIRRYSADITEPTGVNELLAELMDSAPVVFWPNERERRIEMRAIKEPPASRPTLTDAQHFLSGSLEIEQRPKDRVDAVLVHFGQLDPTEDREDAANYAQSYYLIAADAQRRYGTQQIREVYSRWIARFSKSHAEDLADSYIKRYRETPVTIKFGLDAKHGELWTGDVFRADTVRLQDATGANAPRNFQVIEAYEDEPGHLIEYEAESYDWWLSEDDDGGSGGGSDEEIRLAIGDDGENLNLRTLYDENFAVVAATVRVIIEAGVTFRSSSSGLPALDVGEWPAGTVLIIENRGVIQGAGGRGGNAWGAGAPSAAEDGGDALVVPSNPGVTIMLNNTAGTLAGGGGGGGAVRWDYDDWEHGWQRHYLGGGGGAGQVPGAGGTGHFDRDINVIGRGGAEGASGTATTGGYGGNFDATIDDDRIHGGHGGGLGEPGLQGRAPSNTSGSVATFYPAGGAGRAVVGNSHLIWVDAAGEETTDHGEIYGPIV